MKLDAQAIEERLSELGDPHQRPGNSGYTDLYFDAAADDDRPLLIVHHIRKTAGTSLREVVRTNYSGASIVRIAGMKRDRGVEVSRERLLDFGGEVWRRLRPEEHRVLRCIASHEANFVQPFVDRRCVVASLIRDPVERTLSYYYFAQRSFTKADGRVKAGRKSLSKMLRQIPLEDLYDPTRERWPEEVLERLEGRAKALEDKALWKSLFNGQARSLLEPHFDVSKLAPTAGPDEDADHWRDRLFSIVDAHYVLGVSERFESFVRELAQRFGWEAVFAPQMKVNDARPRVEGISSELARKIADHNWLDVELYERQLGRTSAEDHVTGRG